MQDNGKGKVKSVTTTENKKYKPKKLSELNVSLHSATHPIMFCFTYLATPYNSHIIVFEILD